MANKKIFTKKEIQVHQKKKKEFFDYLNDFWNESAWLLEDKRKLEIENKMLKKQLNIK